MAKGKEKRAAQCTEFLQHNVELLGFGNAHDALIQTVKELFENALDAVCNHTDMSTHEMLRVSARLDTTTRWVNVVCSDTGTGIRTQDIKDLCCGAFETTKTISNQSESTLNCGKYGIGLKASILYSQQHDPDACLKIVTTSNSSEILYVKLQINPQSEEPALVQHLTQFVVDEEHHKFSGTEMRLSIPCPDRVEEIEDVADTLAIYFQSLRYTIPSFVDFKFVYEIGETVVEVECNHSDHVVDRFIKDLEGSPDDVIYYKRERDEYVLNSMTLIKMDPSEESRTLSNIDVTLLRFANHVPLLNAEDIHLCAITKGFANKKVWKKHAYHCTRGDSHLLNHLHVSPKQSDVDVIHHNKLIVAIDITAKKGFLVKYGGLRKTTLDKSYTNDIVECCKSILQQLCEKGMLPTLRQYRDEELLEVYAPLIANAASSILNKSKTIQGLSNGQAVDVDRVTLTLQTLVDQVLH